MWGNSNRGGIAFDSFPFLFLLFFDKYIFTNNSYVGYAIFYVLWYIIITQKINCAMVIDDDEVIGIVTSEDLIKLLAHSHDTLGDAETLDLALLDGFQARRVKDTFGMPPAVRSASAPIRSARSRTCPADSSPVT